MAVANRINLGNVFVQLMIRVRRNIFTVRWIIPAAVSKLSTLIDDWNPAGG
ncbi:hypothetical protein D3C87_2043800 [compost metagenome]